MSPMRQSPRPQQMRPRTRPRTLPPCMLSACMPLPQPPSMWHSLSLSCLCLVVADSFLPWRIVLNIIKAANLTGVLSEEFGQLCHLSWMYVPRPNFLCFSILSVKSWGTERAWSQFLYHLNRRNWIETSLGTTSKAPYLLQIGPPFLWKGCKFPTFRSLHPYIPINAKSMSLLCGLGGSASNQGLLLCTLAKTFWRTVSWVRFLRR